MAHHLGTPTTSTVWAEVCNDLIHRLCTLFPENFIGVCQLPQAPDASPANCVGELRRCVEQLGFVGRDLSPHFSGGYWKEVPLTGKFWQPFYEEMMRLDVRAMIHLSSPCNPAAHTTGAHFINGDTTASMQFLLGDLFRDFPTLCFVIPYGCGAVPYHLGRYRGLSLEQAKRPLESILNNVFFRHERVSHARIELLASVLPVDNILFGSEIIGAITGRNPYTERYFDDTKLHVDTLSKLSNEDRRKIFEGNARRVYPRLNQALNACGR